MTTTMKTRTKVCRERYPFGHPQKRWWVARQAKERGAGSSALSSPWLLLGFLEKANSRTKETMRRARQYLTFSGVYNSTVGGVSQQVILATSPCYIYLYHLQFATLWRTYSSSIVRKPREFDELTPVRVIGVTLVRSGAHQPPDIRKNLKALKLYKMHQTVYHPNIACIRGIIHKVQIRLPLAQSHFTVRCDSSSNWRQFQNDQMLVRIFDILACVPNLKCVPVLPAAPIAKMWFVHRAKGTI